MSKNTVEIDRYALNAVVHTMIWRQDGELLLLKRVNTGFMDGRHTLPGGYLQEGESLRAAAGREVTEEVGIVAEEINPVCALPYRGGVNFVFSSERWRGEPRNAEPHKCAGVAWHSPSRLPETSVFWLTTALKMRESGIWFHDFNDA